MDILPGGFRGSYDRDSHSGSSYSFQPKVAYIPLRDDKKEENGASLTENSANSVKNTFKTKLRNAL